MTVEEVQALGQAIRAEIGKAVVGHDATVDLLLVALFAGGHVLLEGPPGTAKTLLAHAFAKTVGRLFTDEPYGIGVDLAHPEMVEFVNLMLERMRADGSLRDLSEKWLGEATEPPPAVYGREPQG